MQINSNNNNPNNNNPQSINHQHYHHHHHHNNHQCSQQPQPVQNNNSNNPTLAMFSPQPFLTESQSTSSLSSSSSNNLPIKVEDIKSEYQTKTEYNPDSEIGYINRVEFVVKIDKFLTRQHYTVKSKFQNLLLIVEPNDIVRYMRNYLVIDLQSGSNQGKLDYLYQISLIKGEHELHYTQEMRKTFINGFPVSGSLYHLRRSILMNPANGFLVNDTVTFFVMVS